MTAASNRELHIYSGGFNYRARKPWPARADLFVDLRRRFRNPIEDPELRELTGKSALVSNWVFRSPGANAYLRGLKTCIHAMMFEPSEHPAVVILACAGGRHRSVAFAEALRHAFVPTLFIQDWRVSVTHLHIDMTECVKCEQYRRDYAWRTCPEHQPADRFDPFK